MSLTPDPVQNQMGSAAALRDSCAVAAVLSSLCADSAVCVAVSVRAPSVWNAQRWARAVLGLPQPKASPSAPAVIACAPALLRQVAAQMGFKVLREQRTGRFETRFDLACGGATVPAVPATVYGHCLVMEKHCRLDGRDYAIHRGNWAFYVPELEVKILHSRDGRRWCFHGSRPGADLLAAGDDAQPLGPYSLADWRASLSMPVLRRVAENHVSARRLASVGAGPAVGRCILIRSLAYEGLGGACVSAGFEVANLTRYVRKPPCGPDDLIRAGVQVDRIASALRQQINGYVSDLDSVLGVVPLDAEAEVQALEARLMGQL